MKMRIKRGVMRDGACKHTGRSKAHASRGALHDRDEMSLVNTCKEAHTPRHKRIYPVSLWTV